MGASCFRRAPRSREVAGPASRTRRLGAACAAARTHALSQDIVIQAHYHIGAARRTCSIARACERARMMGEQRSRSGGRLLAVRRGARALEPARGWCQRTPRAAVPACGPHGAASHRADLFEASARSTARAYFGRTKNTNICAHIGPKDGDNSKPGPTCAVPPIEPRAPMTEGAQRSAHRADRSNCAPAQVGHACGELPAVRLGPPDGSFHANGSVS